MKRKTIFDILDEANAKAKNEVIDILARAMDEVREAGLLPPLNTAVDIQVALIRMSRDLKAIHDAADTLTPNGTPELYNAIESLMGALRDIEPYVTAELKQGVG